MYIAGISAFYHDAAACLLHDGEVIAAAQEERFTRRKHDPSFPAQALLYCLAEAGIEAQQLEHVVFYEKPFPKFERILETYLAFAPLGFANFSRSLPSWIKEKLFLKSMLTSSLDETLGPGVDWIERLLFSEHHLSHAASAFYPSPFESAAVLTIDGVGEWTTTSLAHGFGNELRVLQDIQFPHSLGLLYSAFTYYLGFKVNSGEYKVMGLAPYGLPKYARVIREHLIDLREDGSFALDLSYFDYCTGLTMTNPRFHDLFGSPPRSPEAPLEARHMDLAASVQEVLEDAVLRLARHASRVTSERKLCLAGGVALNCVANGKLLRDNIFDGIWVQPAAGDAGGAVGAALSVHHQMQDAPRRPLTSSASGDGMHGCLLGPSYSDEDCSARLNALGAVFNVHSEEDTIELAAHALASGQVIGWHSGRMEFGPRSLGSRSILADPRLCDMQKTLNLKVKYRESFRPFAPSVLREDVGDWFEFDIDSPYMLFVTNVREERRREIAQDEQVLFGIDRLNVPRSEIPAVTHVDYSARVQTVRAEAHPRFHRLLSRFKDLTGCPVLVNTSFNVRGEPIVCTPEDAFHCFMATELDMLFVGNLVLSKHDQTARSAGNYRAQLELD